MNTSNSETILDIHASRWGAVKPRICQDLIPRSTWSYLAIRRPSTAGPSGPSGPSAHLQKALAASWADATFTPPASELQIFFGWLRVDSGHVSKSIRSMDVYGWFIGIVWHLSQVIFWCDRSPPTEQSVHVVEESAEQTTKDANEGKYKHLHNVIPCLLCGPDTTDQEQNSWSDKLAWQKGNSLVKFINGKSLPVWQSIYPYCSSICRSQCHKLNKLNKLKTTRSFTNASLNASPWNETSVNLPKLTGTPVPNLAKVRLTRQTGDQTLGDQAMSQTSSL